ncbi:hypothetical protein BGZ52_009113, partial [Haplosporangium bisporale]
LVELSDVELDAKYPKFIEQMQKGKGYLCGLDPLNRPMSVTNTRRHHKSDQLAETIHRFTLFESSASSLSAIPLQMLHSLTSFIFSCYSLHQIMECSRTVLPIGSETVIVIFNLSNFDLDNMDWGFVCLFIQCFKSYYPETLGACVVHRAPSVFWGLWKLIQPLLDPVVAFKFVFTRKNKELRNVVPRGPDDWKYKCISAVEDENAHQKDLVKKEELMAERHALKERFDTVTHAWVKVASGKSDPECDEIAQQL